MKMPKIDAKDVMGYGDARHTTDGRLMWCVFRTGSPTYNRLKREMKKRSESRNQEIIHTAKWKQVNGKIKFLIDGKYVSLSSIKAKDLQRMITARVALGCRQSKYKI